MDKANETISALLAASRQIAAERIANDLERFRSTAEDLCTLAQEMIEVHLKNGDENAAAKSFASIAISLNVAERKAPGQAARILAAMLVEYAVASIELAHEEAEGAKAE